MTCLTDVELQAVVDNESSEAARVHVESCPRCGARLEERRHQMARLEALMETEGNVPSGVETRLRQALRLRGSAPLAPLSSTPVRGATALRGSAPGASSRRLGWISALATAAVIGLVIFVIMFTVLPRLGAPTTLSASTILGRSLQTLSATHGIELVEYELALGGAAAGPRRIEQLVDHEHPSRFRLASYDPDGVLQSAISQDPFTGLRSHLIRVDGRNYVFHLTSAEAWLPSLPQAAQAQLEAVITMMQASSDPKLTVLDSSDGRQYVIQIPPVTPKAGAGVLDLYQARAVIDAGDFHLREFEASGALLKQPYTVSFKLIRRQLKAATDVSRDEFEIPTAPGDVVLEGQATNDPMTDVLGTVLRELGRIKGQ